MRMLLAILFFVLSVAWMFSFLVFGPKPDSSYGFPLVLAGIVAIMIFSWAGLFARSLAAYAVFSTLVQSAYFVLDAGSAIMTGKSLWFAVIQALNFTMAGGLFMLVLALLYWTLRKENIADYAGLYEKNMLLVFALSLGCLSLGGMAGFNIFVGEFLLYSFLFAIHPSLAILAILAGLVCFLFYFRICYTLMVRKSNVTVSVPLGLRLFAIALSLLVVGLGVVPHVLLRVLEVLA